MSYCETTEKILAEYEEIKENIRTSYKYTEFDVDEIVHEPPQIYLEEIDLKWVIGCLEPESVSYGKALGLFVYKPTEKVYLFNYNLHTPEFNGRWVSNSMTSIQEVIWKDWKEFSGVNTEETSFGGRAFWAHTPLSCLGYDDRCVRMLMTSMCGYVRTKDYLKQLRRSDKKHLAWEAALKEKQELRLKINSDIGVSDGLKE